MHREVGKTQRDREVTKTQKSEVIKMADETKSTVTENPTGTQPTEGKQDAPTVEELMAQLATEKADRAKEKQALDKALKEKGELTKALRAKQTTEEQEAEAKAEAERLQNEKYEEAIKELNHIKAVNAYKSVSEKSIEKLIDAVSDADHNAIAAIIEAEKKAAVAEAQMEWMKSRPRMNIGGEYSGMTKEQIMAIPDRAERRKAIAMNMELFN